MILLFWLFRLKSRIISLLPFRVIYFLSDIIYPLFYYVFRYRKKVILENLCKSFPSKSDKEILSLASKFYKSLLDISLETIKMEHMTKSKYKQRVTLKNEELLTKIASQNQGAVIVMSHTGNWEWVCQRIAFAGEIFNEMGVIAKEMTNPYFEKYFRFIRLHKQSEKVIMVPFMHSARYVSSARKSMKMIVTIADQTPHKNQINFRSNFLNQDTPVFLGPEKIGKALDYAVIFCHTKRTGRGRYELLLELISENPKSEKEYDITKAHLKMLENDIISQPESWLWSHRRWKY